jgi:hypothetical protein
MKSLTGNEIVSPCNKIGFSSVRMAMRHNTALDLYSTIIHEEVIPLFKTDYQIKLEMVKHLHELFNAFN